MEIGSIDYTLKRTSKYIVSAKKHINTLPDSEAKSDLLALIDYFTARQY